jgi:hypothetical protein
VNLLNLTETHAEYELKESYRKIVEKLEDLKDFLTYYEFDFHKIVHRSNFERLDDMFNDTKDYFDQFGYTEYNSSVNNLVKSQSGVFRTNCLDCLDRTNVVQAKFARKHIDRIISDLGVTCSKEEQDRIEELCNNLFADNGDWLSYIYAGTGALKSSATRNGGLTVSGLLDDAAKSVHRAYIHKVHDSYRQQSIDILLGTSTTLSLDRKTYFDLLGITTASNVINYTAAKVTDSVNYTAARVTDGVNYGVQTVSNTKAVAYNGVSYVTSVVSETSRGAINVAVSTPSTILNIVKSKVYPGQQNGMPEAEDKNNANEQGEVTEMNQENADLKTNDEQVVNEVKSNVEE